MCKGYGGDPTQNSRRKIPGLRFQAKRNEGGEHTVEVFLKFFGSLYWKKKFYDGEWTEGLIILKLVLLHQAPSCTLSPRGSVNQPGAVPSPHTLGISVLHPYNKKLLLLVGSRAEASGRTKQYTQVNSEWIKPLLFLFIDPLNVACPKLFAKLLFVAGCRNDSRDMPWWEKAWTPHALALYAVVIRNCPVLGKCLFLSFPFKIATRILIIPCLQVKDPRQIPSRTKGWVKVRSPWWIVP